MHKNIPTIFNNLYLTICLRFSLFSSSFFRSYCCFHVSSHNKCNFHRRKKSRRRRHEKGTDNHQNTNQQIPNNHTNTKNHRSIFCQYRNYKLQGVHFVYLQNRHHRPVSRSSYDILSCRIIGRGWTRKERMPTVWKKINTKSTSFAGTPHNGQTAKTTASMMIEMKAETNNNGEMSDTTTNSL